MLISLDENTRNILCCPICKGHLSENGESYACLSCGILYPRQPVDFGKHQGYVWDFRIQTPAYCSSAVATKWRDIQTLYETHHARRRRKDELEHYLEEIDSVKEIYRNEFHLKGAILDIGGHQGRLRHFLKEEEVSLYVSADPYANVFEKIEHQTNLLKAYPCLTRPCNFVVCHGENLPFKNASFDWVHIRSVLDHVYDAHRVLVEAYRVLKTGGAILIGIGVTGGQSTLEEERKVVPTYVSPIVPRILRLLKNLRLIRASKYELTVFASKPLDDAHMCRWRYEDLIDLLAVTHFRVTKEHWLKPGHGGFISIAAEKQLLDV